MGEGRGIQAVTVIGYCDGKQTGVYKGQVEGSLCLPRGEFGFGWDSIFCPTSSIEKKTFAEMAPEEKNDHSMRRLAMPDTFFE